MDIVQHTYHALTHTKEAKADLTHEDGIGTDLLPAIFAWSTTGHGYAILAEPHPHNETNLILKAINTLANGMNIHTATIIKEGYAAQHPTKQDPRPLNQRFAQGDPTVHECLAAYTINTKGQATILIAPYTIGLGRTVNWHTPPKPITTSHTKHPVTAAAHTAITPTTRTTQHQALEQLDHLGFAILWVNTHPTPHHN